MAVQKAQSLLAGYHTAGLGQAVAVHGPRSLKCFPRHPRATGLLLDNSVSGRVGGLWGFTCVPFGDRGRGREHFRRVANGQSGTSWETWPPTALRDCSIGETAPLNVHTSNGGS